MCVFAVVEMGTVRCVVAVLAAFSLFSCVNSHKYHFGECPEVPPMDDFVMDKVRIVHVFYLLRDIQTAGYSNVTL